MHDRKHSHIEAYTVQYNRQRQIWRFKYEKNTWCHSSLSSLKIIAIGVNNRALSSAIKINEVTIENDASLLNFNIMELGVFWLGVSDKFRPVENSKVS